MKNRIRDDKYRCVWCGDSLNTEKDLIDHKRRRHSDYGAHDEVSKLNYKLIAKERKEKKDIKEEAERSYVPAPISESEVREIMEEDLSNLTSMEILMRLDQGDEWEEKIRLLDELNLINPNIKNEHKVDVETSRGKFRKYDWDYLRGCVKKEEKIQGDIKSDRIVRAYNNKRDGRDIQNERNDNQAKSEKGKYSNVKISKRRLSLADIRFGKSYIRDE